MIIFKIERKGEVMVKKICFFVSIFYLIFVGCQKNEECISLKEAEDIVLYQIVGADTMEWDTTKIRVYELPYMLEEGDTVSGENSHIVIEKCWFFFIDDHPTARWNHPCRFVFIHCDRDYEIKNEMFLPYTHWDEMIEIKW